MTMSAPNNFESLARSIDSDERNQMLSKLNAVSQGLTADTSLTSDSENIAEVERDLSVTYKQESFLLKLWIALKSLITGSTQEILYNDMLVIKKGHDISKSYPELYDSKTGTLLNGMYEQLRQIRLVADHFKGAIKAYSQNPGEFYVFMGSLLIPELTQEINEEASPFSIPYEREVTGELRLSLIRRLDDILTNIEVGQRNQLYQAAQSIDWLAKFCELPFDKILSRFSSFESGSFTCPVEILNTDLATFARVLCHPKSISVELIAAMYYLVSDVEDRNDEDEARKFREKSIKQLQMLKLFLSTVPLRDITCVAYNSAMWYPDENSGVEDWFVKYKSQWRKVFDSQWEKWLSERRKNQVLKTVQKIFDTQVLFLPPNRPWMHVWGGVAFSRDYTLGFLNAFFTTKMQNLSATMKKLAIEGSFVLKENRTLCAEITGEITQQEQFLKAILLKLRSGGFVFEQLMNISAEKVQSIQNKSNLDTVLLSLETEVVQLTNRFTGTLRETVSLLEGILLIRRSAKFDTLTNINQIGGSYADNIKFKDLLAKIHNELIITLSILREMESIEAAS